MYINTSINGFFNNIMKDTGIIYKSVYDDYKRDGTKVYTKYKIKSADIDIQNLSLILSKYNGCYLEYDFNGDVYARISNMNAIIKVRTGAVYLVVSFIDTISKEMESQGKSICL